jgi:surfactin synthase thioesterase subunit
LLREPTQEAPARLFCFPYSGVGASMYNRWPRQLGPAEVCPVQLPGRENRIREPHYGTYEELAERLVEALPPYLDRPFAFFGHCGGALPAFATAVRLAELDLPVPACLFVSSQVAPHDGPFGRFLGMSDAELTVELTRLVVAMGGRAHPDMLELGLSVLRADVAANRAYHLAAPVVLPSVVHTLGWTDDREIRPEQMTGWSRYAHPGRFRCDVLPGTHYAFLAAPAELVDVLTAGLQRALRDEATRTRRVSEEAPA